MATETRPTAGPTNEPPRPVGGRDADTTTGLLRRLADDLTVLLRKELALASGEISRKVDEARSGVAAIATGGAVLFAGFLFLLLAATAALAEVMDDWLAALIVGGIVAIVGYAMLASGRKKLKPASLKPELTQASLRQDKELLHRSTK